MQQPSISSSSRTLLRLEASAASAEARVEALAEALCIASFLVCLFPSCLCSSGCVSTMSTTPPEHGASHLFARATFCPPHTEQWKDFADDVKEEAPDAPAEELSRDIYFGGQTRPRAHR